MVGGRALRGYRLSGRSGSVSLIYGRGTLFSRSHGLGCRLCQLSKSNLWQRYSHPFGELNSQILSASLALLSTFPLRVHVLFVHISFYSLSIILVSASSSFAIIHMYDSSSFAIILVCFLLYCYYSRICFFLICYYSSIWFFHFLYLYCSRARGIQCGIHTPCMRAPVPAVRARCSPVFRGEMVLSAANQEQMK